MCLHYTFLIFLNTSRESDKSYMINHVVFSAFRYLVFRVYFSRSSRPEVFCKKSALENFAQENTLVRVSFFLRPATLLKKRLWHRCFPRNFTKILKTPSSTEHLRWLLLFLTILFLVCEWIQTLRETNDEIKANISTCFWY